MTEKKEKTELKTSVGNIVEFILRRGNLESSFTGSRRAVEGTRAHQKVQKGRDQEKYQAEISLSFSMEYEDYILTINGRADGIIKENNEIIIEEIKSTNYDLNKINEDYNPIHWAQAMVYAYIYANKEELEEVNIQLTYFHLETEKSREFRRHYSYLELEEFFLDLIKKYRYWADSVYQWSQLRNRSIEELEFPFPLYRKGQRELAVSVYKTILDGKNLFTQAPTGIGKTISTLFPAIKAIGENLIKKVFYLTAKTVSRQVVEENLALLYKDKLRLKALTLTAKEKICFQEKVDCNPELCPFACGHYDRVNEALKDILKEEDLITREKIEKYADKHQVCPFEFSLDLATQVDLLICDYNYLFDPRVALKRFFVAEGADYLFLVDEAHNLIDRAREMYSATLYLNDFIILKDELEKNQGKKGEEYYKLLAYLKRIIELLFSYQKKIQEDSLLKEKTVYRGSIVQKEEPIEYFPLLYAFLNKAEEFLIESQKDAAEGLLELVQDQYFNVLAFMRIIELYDDNFITYFKESRAGEEIKSREINNNFMIKIFCLAPREELQQMINKGRTAIFFSATLTPLKYHREILGGNEDDYFLDLPSPFDSKNLCLILAPTISTRYGQRERGYGHIADYIATSAYTRKGNYLVFFPSYAYMAAVVEVFEERYPDFNIIIQKREMTEKERLDYLKRFGTREAVIGFAVLGGVFSEGVDLKGERLLGSIIVGVAHPQISLERELIREYFQEKNRRGYEFAYLYPGINKVLQAAGRTIRSEDDRGLVLLIGERFNTYRYKKLLPAWWKERKRVVLKKDDISKELENFWL